MCYLWLRILIFSYILIGHLAKVNEIQWLTCSLGLRFHCTINSIDLEIVGADLLHPSSLQSKLAGFFCHDDHMIQFCFHAMVAAAWTSIIDSSATIMHGYSTSYALEDIKNVMRESYSAYLVLRSYSIQRWMQHNQITYINPQMHILADDDTSGPHFLINVTHVKVFSISLILSLQHLSMKRLTMLMFNEQSYEHQWLRHLRDEIFNELSYRAHITLVIGIPRLSVTHDDEFYSAQCTSLADFFSVETDGLTVACLPLTESTLSSEESLKHGWSESDAREKLSREAYLTFDSDVYLLLDMEVIISAPGWILFGVSRLIQFQGLNSDIGVLIVDCASLRHSASHSFCDGEYCTARRSSATIFLKRGHFKAFPNETTLNFPGPLWASLIYNIYQNIGSLTCGDDFMIFQHNIGSDSNAVLRMSQHVMGTFWDNVLAVQSAFLLYLNTGMYQDFPVRGDIDQFSLLCSNNLEHKLLIFAGTCASSDTLNILDNHNGSGDLQTFSVTTQNGVQEMRFSKSFSVDESNGITAAAPSSLSAAAMPSVASVASIRVAVITAIFGRYEASLKWQARQTISTDFYCFSDRTDMHSRGWIVVNTPYHLQQLEIENIENSTHHHNSFHRNMHPFNIAKYYKQRMHEIPILIPYDILIWIDGTVSITNPQMSELIVRLLKENNEMVVVFENAFVNGSIWKEANASCVWERYTNEKWLGFAQPFQDVLGQYHEYIDKYEYNDVDYWSTQWEMKLAVAGKPPIARPDLGIWCTCFVAWNMMTGDGIRDKSIRFMQHWAEQTQRFTTQDQLSFPFVAQQLKVFPYTLPDEGLYGNMDHNSLFIKLPHGM